LVLIATHHFVQHCETPFIAHISVSLSASLQGQNLFELPKVGLCEKFLFLCQRGLVNVWGLALSYSKVGQ
jgi:hypothetical protein